MNFLNQIVIHKAWGEGIVTRQEKSVLYVSFGADEKRFGHPDSFAGFLEGVTGIRPS